MVTTERPAANAFVAWARKIYNPVGFSKGYNFVLWIIFLGAFWGFTLARLEFLNFYGVFCGGKPSATGHAAPGECFYWLQTPYNVGMILHLGCILPAALLAGFQFIPIIRHKFISIHRVNGYIAILLSLPGTAGAFMIMGRAFGGGMDIRTIGGALGISFILALVLAYINIKRLQIEQHRAWMLRAWFWAGCIITQRLIFFIGLSILPRTGTYYNNQPCDKIDYLLGNQNKTLSLYPECAAYYSGAEPGQEAVVLARMPNATDPAQVAAAMDMFFGASLGLAWVLHIVAVEAYLRLTPAESERLRQVSYQRQLEAGMKHPGRAGLTADRLGDAEKWAPRPVDPKQHDVDDTSVQNAPRMD